MDGDGIVGRDGAMGGDVVARYAPRADVLVRGLFENRDLHVGEFRDVARHGIARPNQSFLDHHHRGDAKHGLRRGHHDEDGVLLHRAVFLDIHEPVGLEVHDLAAPGDRSDRPLDVAGGDVALHGGVDSSQTLARHADRLGLRRGQSAAVRRGCGERENGE